MNHPGGYGGIRVSDCHIIPGLPHAMCPVWKDDNSGTIRQSGKLSCNMLTCTWPVGAAGPPIVDQVLLYYAILQKEFPNAVIEV